MSNATPRLTVRIDEPLWSAALTLARERGDNLSNIIRDALRAYVNKWRTLSDP